MRFIGFASRKKSSSFESFLSGHQDIEPIITGPALGASWLSGWATLGMMGVLMLLDGLECGP